MIKNHPLKNIYFLNSIKVEIMHILLSNIDLNRDIKQMFNKYFLNSINLFDVVVGRICYLSQDKNSIIESIDFCLAFVKSK